MPWNESEAMTERERFVMLAQSGRFSIKDLCADFGVSRKSGHKYLQRYNEQGRDGLKDKSRRPKNSPSGVDEGIERLVLMERRKHPRWGAKKIHDLLLKVHGVSDRPHINTVNNILNRNGLTKKRKRRTGVHRIRPENLTEPTRANEVWTFDFKGWFYLGDGSRCEPLTVCDRYSRYIIGCKAQSNQQFNTTLKSCKNLMRHYGLPEVIRVDNGTPFASIALGGFSRLSVSNNGHPFI